MGVTITGAPTLPSINDPATFNDRALSLFTWLTGSFITQIENMDANDYFSVQSDAVDTTSGRVLTVGAFGLGEDAGPVISSFDTHTTSGFYTAYGGGHASATPGTNPFSSYNGALALLAGSSVNGDNDDFLWQIAMKYTANVQEMKVRVATALGWNDWLSVPLTDSSGNLGIGTDTPTRKLYVAGTFGVSGAATFEAFATFETTTVFDGGIYSDSPADAIKGMLRARDSGGNNAGQLVADGFDGVGGRSTWTFQGTIEDVIFDMNGDVGIGQTSPTGRFDVRQPASGSPGIKGLASSASFTNAVTALSCSTAASSAFNFLTAYSSGGDLEFKLSGNGNGTCDGSWTGGGADYAEYFEWADGNPGAEDRRGLSVVLDGDKIRPAKSGETPIGVISANPSVIGDGDIDRWKGKFLRDDYGEHILEDCDVIEWIEEVTEEVDGEKTSRDLPHSYPEDEIPEGLTPPKDATRKTLQRRMIDPAYDPDMPYVPRAERPEWSTVGLMGKLRLRKGQPVDPRWIKMRDVSADVEEWLVR
ncbi:peptidase G2 autoproteolytic cleavage domain-containing protein [Thiosulfatihalobacter marinus]|uniref:peptidase G2 autoproteolytic cleavage domain-containing protein n=1 Tax=Thiosulfatihalobacter marinus TaxID=2792481 RepID=UPI0018D70B4D|nr:peptidase G2 autoproteolytic cleavage domain-containing protein [Thiosulfatihalobacter marinus]